MSVADSVFEAFEQYPFNTDPVFTGGVESILAPLRGRPQEVQDEAIRKAKAFYFSRSSGVQISWDDYLDYRNRKNEQLSSSSTSEESVPVPSESAVPAPGGLHGAAPPLSFTNIADMIISGKTHLIPNNDMVSNELNEEQPSESKAQAPRKPWEKDAPIISDELLAPEATVSP